MATTSQADFITDWRFTITTVDANAAELAPAQGNRVQLEAVLVKTEEARQRQKAGGVWDAALPGGAAVERVEVQGKAACERPVTHPGGQLPDRIHDLRSGSSIAPLVL